MSRTILVVDDSEIVLAATQAMLEEGGYQVTTHRRATGSVALILQTKPDLVLLDVNMPSLRGDMVARMSTATNQATRTVVVLHSTLSERELQLLAAECGAHGYIRKTNNTQAFLRRVRQFLEEGTSSTIAAASRVSSSEFDVPSSRKSAKKEGVLLVDGDMMALSALRKQVQSMGYTPSYALSVSQAKGKLRSESPDVLIVSDQMGEWRSLLDGLPSSTLDRCILVCNSELSAPAGFLGRVVGRPVSNAALAAVMQYTLGQRASTGS